MNTNNLKKYAPQARRDFMAAVSQRLNQFGIHADNKGKLTVSTPVISGSVMQIEGLSFDTGLARAREKLVQRAERMGFEQVVEQMAYTWFNRLSAIRFMELHGYLDHNLRVLSPSNNTSSRQGLPGSSPQGSETPTPSMASGFRQSLPERRAENTLPEILAHAQDVAADLGLDRNHIVELKLAGNKDEELYRTLLLGQCHQLQLAMPFLFEALDDETELLLPDNLTRTDSILRGLVESRRKVASGEWLVGSYRLPDLLEALDLEGRRKVGENLDLFERVVSDEWLVASEKLTTHHSPLTTLLALFEQAKTLGSLIQVPQEQAEYLRNLTSRLQELAEQGDTMQKPAAMTLLPYVQQAWVLAQQYDAVVANPPYMGGKGMNASLKEFAKKQFPDSKSDLFAMFIERGFGWCKPNGFNSMVTMQSWMFLSSYEALREKLLSTKTVNTMAHLGARAFSEISGEVVQTTAFVFHGDYFSGYKPAFFRLVDGNEEQKQTALLSCQNRFDKTVQEDFKKISGSPVAYWVSECMAQFFLENDTFGKFGETLQGMTTCDNDFYLRLWWEISIIKVGFHFENRKSADESKVKWFPYTKGGSNRKWYGNNEYLVNWENDGKLLRTRKHPTQDKVWAHNFNLDYIFRSGASYSSLSSASFSCRYTPSGYIFDQKGSMVFTEPNQLLGSIGFLNSIITNLSLEFICPTLDFNPGALLKLPCKKNTLSDENVSHTTSLLIEISKIDWNNYETSWDFTENPLIRQLKSGEWLVASDENKKLTTHHSSLATCFNQWQTQNSAAITEMKRLEEENNRLFIEAYGLQDELTPEVPEDQITLTRADQEKDIQRLISYAIGCMMGRYRLDRPGLIYAHAGNVDFDEIYSQKNVGWVSDSVTQQSTNADVGLRCANPTYAPDEDGILPLTDQEWFKDDASNRFREFLLAVWGEDSLQQNLAFVAESLTLSNFKPKKGETSLDTVRRYLSNQFYKDHLQTYKKRPIYWLFSSGKQKAFECLVYLHRYNDSTLARMRTEYVSPLLGKYSAYADQLNQQLQDASSSEATRIKKDLLALEKKQTELRQFDDKLKHYADMRIKLDLDDGVKVNYGKFGDLLAEVKVVTGGTGD